MAEIKGSERVIFSNMKSITVTPWTNESTIGSTTYDLTEVVGDTTSLEQAENESSAIESEFRSTPLYENIQLGEKTFTLEMLDLQESVLTELFGWEETEDGVIAPNSYKALYATIILRFNSTDRIIVLPKVLLNSRAIIASMKTDASRANIAGTCYTAFVGGKETDMAIFTNESGDMSDTAILAKIKPDSTGV